MQIVQAHLVEKLNTFVEYMCDHDELLQSVCWTISCVAFATDGEYYKSMCLTHIVGPLYNITLGSAPMH